MKCWASDKAERAWFSDLSNKLCTLEEVELSLFCLYSPNTSSIMKKESQFLLLPLCLHSCWLLSYSQAGEAERCSPLKTPSEAGASLGHLLACANYCKLLTYTVAYWALQSVRLRRAVEDTPVHSSATFFFCPAFWIHACLWACVTDASRLRCWVVGCLWSLLWEGAWGWGVGQFWGLLGRGADRTGQPANMLESEGPYMAYQPLSLSPSPVCSFCFLPDCTHRLPTAPQGIALLLPQLQSVHISLN